MLNRFSLKWVWNWNFEPKISSFFKDLTSPLGTVHFFMVWFEKIQFKNCMTPISLPIFSHEPPSQSKEREVNFVIKTFWHKSIVKIFYVPPLPPFIPNFFRMSLPIPPATHLLPRKKWSRKKRSLSRSSRFDCLSCGSPLACLRWMLLLSTFVLSVQWKKDYFFVFLLNSYHWVYIMAGFLIMVNTHCNKIVFV